MPEIIHNCKTKKTTDTCRAFISLCQRNGQQGNKFYDCFHECERKEWVVHTNSSIQLEINLNLVTLVVISLQVSFPHPIGSQKTRIIAVASHFLIFAWETEAATYEVSRWWTVGFNRLTQVGAQICKAALGFMGIKKQTKLFWRDCLLCE